MGEEQNLDEDDGDVYPPWNFSWVERGKLAIMACPHKAANLRFLVEQGINHLVTLSSEKRPPSHQCNELKYTNLFVKEFQAPTLKQINSFIDICQRSSLTNEVVGVHCRMGRGRAGVMGACYLVRFNDYTPERAIGTIRMQRPGSVESYEQENIVKYYFDCLRGTVINDYEEKPEESETSSVSNCPINKEPIDVENSSTQNNEQ